MCLELLLSQAGLLIKMNIKVTIHASLKGAVLIWVPEFYGPEGREYIDT